MTKIIIVDDHKMFCEGIASMLNDVDEIEIIGIANSGKELLSMLTLYQADLILMDINMPNMDGIEASQSIKHLHPQIKIIMLTMHKQSEMIRRLIKLGVNGYVLKDVGKNELVIAINKVMSGMDYFGEEVVQSLIDVYRSDHVSTEIILTPREKDVLQLICQGLKTQEIAEKLFISKNTVESHRKNLLSKTGSSNSLNLVNFAYKNGLMES